MVGALGQRVVLPPESDRRREAGRDVPTIADVCADVVLEQRYGKPCVGDVTDRAGRRLPEQRGARLGAARRRETKQEIGEPVEVVRRGAAT